MVVSSSESLAGFHWAARRYIPEEITILIDVCMCVFLTMAYYSAHFHGIALRVNNILTASESEEATPMTKRNREMRNSALERRLRSASYSTQGSIAKNFL
jgi:hypothetical protein